MSPSVRHHPTSSTTPPRHQQRMLGHVMAKLCTSAAVIVTCTILLVCLLANASDADSSSSVAAAMHSSELDSSLSNGLLSSTDSSSRSRLAQLEDLFSGGLMDESSLVGRSLLRRRKKKKDADDGTDESNDDDEEEEEDDDDDDDDEEEDDKKLKRTRRKQLLGVQLDMRFTVKSEDEDDDDDDEEDDDDDEDGGRRLRRLQAVAAAEAAPTTELCNYVSVSEASFPGFDLVSLATLPRSEVEAACKKVAAGETSFNIDLKKLKKHADGPNTGDDIVDVAVVHQKGCTSSDKANVLVNPKLTSDAIYVVIKLKGKLYVTDCLAGGGPDCSVYSTTAIIAEVVEEGTAAAVQGQPAAGAAKAAEAKPAAAGAAKAEAKPAAAGAAKAEEKPAAAGAAKAATATSGGGRRLSAVARIEKTMPAAAGQSNSRRLRAQGLKEQLRRDHPGWSDEHVDQMADFGVGLLNGAKVTVGLDGKNPMRKRTSSQVTHHNDEETGSKVTAEAVIKTNPVTGREVRKIKVYKCRTKELWPTKRETKTVVNEGECFPAAALVLLSNGTRAAMHQLRHGDSVLAVLPGGRLGFSEVYMFGHRDPDATSSFVALKTRLNTSLLATPDHYIHIIHAHKAAAGTQLSWRDVVHTPAGKVRPGDALVQVSWGDCKAPAEDITGSIRPDCGRVQYVTIASVGRQVSQGLYNPYTMAGNIVVDGYSASSHSGMYSLDKLTGTGQYVPRFLQALMAPVRLLYRMYPSLVRYIDGQYSGNGWVTASTGSILRSIVDFHK